MKKILSISLAIVMLFTLVATTTIVSAQTTYNIIDSKDYIRPIGRYEWVENGLACDWTATGFEFTADVEGDVSVTMTASCPDVGSKGDWNADGYLTVFIDGVRQNYRVRYISGNLTVNIAEDVAKGVHTFKVVKQNDFGNKVVFNSVNFSGTFGAKPQEKEVIEFVGDSITAGFGSLDNPSNGAARYSDGTRTWAYIIAENFGMDARVIARSGGNINGEYNDYVSNLRAGGSYDYSLKKPKAVVLSFGTNDGVQSVNYWKTGIKKFADAIRTGYNDVNIPIVLITNLMGNDHKTRENIANAIFSLQQDDATAYANIYNVFATTNAGGHPNQAQHLSIANKLTRDVIELGVMEKAELRDDATVTLTENTVAESFVSTCDKLANIGRPNLSTSIYSGITSELVDPLDPADIDSETAKANKFTADGTQEVTTDYRFTKASFGSIASPLMNAKGFSFYLNYKDTDYTGAEGETYTQPYILLTSGDVLTKLAIPGTSAETDGKTIKVEFDWNTMPSLGYVSLRMPNASLGICVDMYGACEYTIDNIKAINTTYRYAVNENKAYTYTTGYDSYPLMGVTDNYAAPTTTVGQETYFTPSDVANMDNWIQGWWDSSNGKYNTTYQNNSRACVKNKVEVQEGTTYKFTISGTDASGLNIVLRSYDSTGAFKTTTILSSDLKYTVPSGIKYVSVTMYDKANLINYITNGTVTASMTVDGAEVPSSSSTTATTTTTTTTTAVQETYFTPSDVANPDNWKIGWWDNNNGSFNPSYYADRRACVKNKIEVQEGVTYNFSISGASSSGLKIYIRAYGENGIFKSSVGECKSYTVPTGIKYVSVTIGDKDILINHITNGTVIASMTVAEQDGETTDLISTDDGASIRLNEVNGMRFYATVNGDISNATEMGIIIAPKDLVKGEFFTMEDDHIKVPYNFKENALWDGNKIVGSIVNLKSSNAYNEATGNLARDYIARAYVVIGETTYYAKETTVRNLAEIADKYIADEKGGYAELDADIKEMVDLWAKAND